MIPVQEMIESWASGVITTLEPDAIPAIASPRGRNSILTSFGGERAAVEKRRGMSVRNRTAISGNPAIIGIAQFKHVSETHHDILVTNNGRVELLNADNSLTNLGTGLSGTDAPDFAQAKSLLFLVNGSYKKKLIEISGSLSLQEFGIARPSAPFVGKPNMGGMTGTYQFAITALNENSGGESSLSDPASITMTGNKVTITAPLFADSQITHWRIHVIKEGLSSQFKEVTSGPGIDAELFAWPVATTSVELDLSDNDLNDLTILSPSTVDNDPPPDGIRYAVWHNNRLFVADDENVYYSQDGSPEAFNRSRNIEPINPQDGQKIKGLISIGPVLIILKQASIWAIEGVDPKTWVKEKLIEGLGGASHTSIVVDPSGVAHWWSPQVGPVSYVPGNAPIHIGNELIKASISQDVLNFAQAGQVCAELFLKENLILFAVAEKNQEGEPASTRNNIILPYNYQTKRWVSDRWDPIDISALGVLEDSNGDQWVHVGGYFGQVFRLWDADNDGVAEGTKKGQVTSATSTTLTDSSATFDTIGAGLKGRYVYAIDTSGKIQRRRIGSNTATQLTLDSGLTWAVTPNSNYTYVVGGIDWEWDTHISLFDQPFNRKRIAFFYTQMKAPSADTLVNVDFFMDYSNSPQKTIELSVSPGGAEWDSAIWDQSRWATESAQAFRKRVALVGLAIKARFRNSNPDEPIILLKAGYQGELLGDQIG